MKNLNLWMVMAAAACAVITSGCFATGPRTVTSCEGTADAFSCTDDLCPSGGGALVHVPVHARCGADRWCDPANPAHDSNGCVGVPPVECPGGCADAFTCTRDFCDAGTCRHVADDTACPGDAVCRATSADGSSGCYAPPVECSSGCDDGVACTVDSCSGGVCRHFADDTACSASQRCDAARDCVDRTTGTFECVDSDGASRIGYTVRLCARGMSGVRTVPNRAGTTYAMTSSAMRVWTLGPDVPAGGCRDYDLSGILGGINTHPFINQWRVDRTGGHPEWDLDILNVADFRSFVGRSAASVGIEAYVCQRATGTCSDGEWVELPEEFYTIAPDTVGTRFWADDPNLHPDITGEVAIRAVLNPGCDESGAHPADL
ncbi:hypothetical protein IT087_01010 [Candidatus Uhrbacteria bacterium]|nr:hypothetical protein [Candidatus Uhrbacteria bacterium]